LPKPCYASTNNFLAFLEETRAAANSRGSSSS
jgi:hypothetical protein